MAYKDLLLALTSYPHTAPASAIDQAIAFAELVGARISAVTFEMELPEPIGFYTDTVLGIADRIAAEQQESVMHARDLLTCSRVRHPGGRCSTNRCSSAAWLQRSPIA